MVKVKHKSLIWLSLVFCSKSRRIYNPVHLPPHKITCFRKWLICLVLNELASSFALMTKWQIYYWKCLNIFFLLIIGFVCHPSPQTVTEIHSQRHSHYPNKPPVVGHTQWLSQQTNPNTSVTAYATTVQ